MMPIITYISPEDKEYKVEAAIGDTLMQIAVDNDVDGIDADCGGACACATCHIIIPTKFRTAAGIADEDESALLDFLDNRIAGSRLSCQIIMNEDLDGMAVKIPELD
ncbi:MAG: 2Fe-2S iron-sulfur cluster binding domain-containing protein [Emcibacteraceae bacterium]|nr:2Fe-2S iron-sulfur cluster binding domain-containing protein [Emcibacteraceae bacterium]